MLGNFRITGNPQSGSGIKAVRINEVFLQGVTVSEHGSHGIFLDYCYEDPRVSDCLMTYNKGSGRITVAGNNFSNSYIGDGQVKRGTDDLAAVGTVWASATPGSRSRQVSICA